MVVRFKKITLAHQRSEKANHLGASFDGSISKLQHVYPRQTEHHDIPLQSVLISEGTAWTEPPLEEIGCFQTLATLAQPVHSHTRVLNLKPLKPSQPNHHFSPSSIPVCFMKFPYSQVSSPWFCWLNQPCLVPQPPVSTPAATHYRQALADFPRIAWQARVNLQKLGFRQQKRLILARKTVV